ncbi:hypothetical protein IFM89_024879 [Coptis chinensis]|uniref:DUF4283 domain-containing protein n=1 Tax=Coptis chinensis TaxID=261450 RepID=A0A835LNH1_9MAGN|nr:hypothetical protein IFM89_024879 [Coptis chinensis]
MASTDRNVEGEDEQGDLSRVRIEKLQADMKNLFCSKEKHVVKIGCKNPRDVHTGHTTLVGKLYGGKHISLQDFADEVHRCWQIKGETKIEVISKGLYKMVFAEVEEYQHVKKNGPWVIQGFILSIKKGDDLGSMGEDRSFDRVDFWVQIFGLPRDRINEKNVHAVGSTLGKVKGMDLHCSSAFKNPVARVRVRMDIKERANVFYNGDVVPILASITFSGPPQKPRMDQIPARNRNPPGKKLWKGDGLWSPPLKDAQVAASVEVRSKGTEGISEGLTEHITDTSVWMITESVTVGEAELGNASNRGVDLDMTELEKAHGSGAKAGPLDPDLRLEESCEALVLWSPSSGMMDMDQGKVLETGACNQKQEYRMILRETTAGELRQIALKDESLGIGPSPVDDQATPTSLLLLSETIIHNFENTKPDVSHQSTSPVGRESACDPAIIDCTCELPRNVAFLKNAYFNVPTWDTRAPQPAQIESAVRWACRKRAQKSPVFVHCAFGLPAQASNADRERNQLMRHCQKISMEVEVYKVYVSAVGSYTVFGGRGTIGGHGRSVAVACALLVALGVAEDWKNAEEMIRGRRPCIRMNALHCKNLEEWSKHRLSSKTNEEMDVSSVILTEASERLRPKRSQNKTY